MSDHTQLYELIKNLSEKKIRIWLEDGALKFKAPKGALDSELKNRMIQNKPALIGFLQAQQESEEGIGQRKNLQDLPISSAQRRLWFIDQYSEQQQKSAYNIPVALELSGSLNIKALKQAIHSLILRHEVLQTCFENRNGLPVQVKVNDLSIKLEVHDLASLPEEEKQTQCEQLIEANLTHCFELNKWPLFKPEIIQLSEQKTIFLASMHHIIADGWSMGIVIKEIANYYQQICEQGEAKFEPLALQYADYAYWQNEQVENQQKQLEFWKTYLQNSTVLELPLDKKRNKNSSQSGRHEHWAISSNLYERLNVLAKEQGVTLFMLLMTAFNILLSKTSLQDDINVGVPVANRNRKEWEPLIGFFVNSLVLRTRIEHEQPFLTLLKQVQENTLAMYSNQDTPFDLLVDELVEQRESTYTPLFQTMFSLQNSPEQSSFKLSGLNIKTLDNTIEQARYDMTWSLSEISDPDKGLEIDLEYRSDLFDTETIKNYLRYFEYLLAAIAENPEQKICEYTLQNPEDILKQQCSFNSPATLYPREETIYHLFEKTAQKYSSEVAVSSEAGELDTKEKQLTYQELFESSEHIASILNKNGLKVAEKAILVFPRSVAMIQSLLAVLKLGACYLPVDPDYPEERKQFIAEDANAELLISSRKLQDKLFAFKSRNLKILFIEDILQESESEKTHTSTVSETHKLAACVFYTSGSTGTPKGVVVPHRAIIRLVQNNQFYDFNHEDVCGHISNVCFDASSMEIWGALLNGGRLHIVSQADLLSVTRFAQIISEQNISVMFLSMGLFRVFAHENPNMFAPMKALLVGGEAVDLNAASTVLAAQKPPLRLINGYGPTENATFTACHEIKEIHQELVSVPLGRSISNTQVFICDTHGNLLPAGIPGELMCAGDGLAIGYLNQDELSKQKFVRGFINSLPDEIVYRSGDLARYSAKGEIILSGRLDEQIKLRGFRIEPGEIENFLESLDQVSSACVVVKQNEPGEKLLVAYLVLAAQEDLTVQAILEEIKEAAREKLPSYMLPGLYQRLEKIPVNANGKVDRKALPEPDWSLVQQDYVAPGNSIERDLEAIWKELLGLEQVSVVANFFELGGHSLLATRLASRIQENYGFELKVKDIFSNPSIQQLAKYFIQRGIVSQDKPPILRLPDEQRFQGQGLSKAQQRLWFMHQMDPDSTAYGMPMAVGIRGALDVERLKDCFAELISRHESLRTCFSSGDQELAQQFVKPTVAFNLELEQCSGNEELEKARLENEKQVFDLAHAPLFSVRLLQTGELSYVLLMNMHHIISDGWSMQILQKELLALYQGEQLEPLNIQYVDFAQWQNTYLDENRTRQLLNYWLEELQDVPHLLQMPLDNPRPRQQSFQGELCHFELDKALQKRALDFCKQNNMSSFVLGISCYALLLSKYAQQNDFCIGIPVSGRGDKDLDKLIGFFVNGIVIRSDLRERLTVSQLLKQFNNRILNAFEHQDLSAEVLIEAMNIPLSNQYQPLAQVAFSHLSVDEPEHQKIGDISFELLESTNHSAKYDLMLSMSDTGEQIHLSCEYASDLFNRETIVQFLSHYESLLDQVLLASDTPVQQLELYTNREVREHLEKAYEITDIESVFPLSFNQQAIYLDTKINPDSKQNAVGNLIDIPQKIDVEIWKSCFEEIQRKHEIFRTSFYHVELPGMSQDFQLVRKNSPDVFSFEDLSDKGLDLDGLSRYVEDIAYCSYQLENEPAYHYTVFKLSDEHFVGMFNVHHIIFDGISGKRLLEDLACLYQARLMKKEFHHEKDNFSQFIQLESFQTDLKPTLDFWKDKAKSIEALSYRKSINSNVSECGFKELRLTFDIQQSKSLKAYCRTQRITPAIFFKSLYAALIYQYCRVESDFYLTEYAHGRPRGFENSYGVYYQQTPFVIPAEIFSDETFSAETFKALFLYAKAFQKEIKDQRGLSIQSQVNLFPRGDIGFMYNYTQFESLIAFGDEVLESRFLSPRVENQVQLFIRERKEDFECLLIYGQHYFVDLMFLERIKQLALGLIEANDPDNLLDVDLQLYRNLNKQFVSKTIPSDPVSKSFFSYCEQTPQRHALICKNDKYSFEQLGDSVRTLASYLEKYVHKSKTPRVALLCEFNLDFMTGVIACTDLGISYLPLSLEMPSERLLGIVNQAGLSAVVSRKDVYDSLPPQVVKQLPEFVDLDELELVPELKKDYPQVDQDSAIYTIFTSGSTGLPKGAQVSFRGEQNLLAWYEKELNITENDVSLIISSPGFDLTQKNLFAFLRNGASIVLPELDIFEPCKILDLIAENNVTHINCAPSAFYALLQEGEKSWNKLASLRWVVLGGEAIKLEELKVWYLSSECHAEIMNSYGPTECTDVVCSYVLTEDDFLAADNQVPLGQAIDNAHIYVLDQNHSLLPAGLSGEIAIGGASLGLGYLEQARLNETQFIEIETPFGQERVYLTGDLGYINSQGQLAYIGRIDFQLKLRGQRIEAGEIEQCLRSHNTIHDALVDVLEEQLVAWFVPSESEVNLQEIRQYLSQHLPVYMCPSLLIAVEKWPLNTNGKIDRSALPEADFSQQGQVEMLLPRNEIEQTLSDIWCEVLGLNEVSVLASFFELGGHSLLATKIVNRMKQAFDLDIQLRAIFDLHTIADLALYIKNLQWALESQLSADGNKKGESEENRDEGFL